jgi:hypothetical protein
MVPGSALLVGLPVHRKNDIKLIWLSFGTHSIVYSSTDTNIKEAAGKAYQSPFDHLLIDKL